MRGILWKRGVDNVEANLADLAREELDKPMLREFCEDIKGSAGIR